MSTADTLRWEPGTLSVLELDRVLVDALADLWLAAFDDHSEDFHDREFRSRLEQAVKNATGIPLCGLPDDRRPVLRDASGENAPVPLAAVDRRNGGGR